MIYAHLFRMDNAGIECSNPDCKHNPDYHYRMFEKVFFIKEGVTCLEITTSGREMPDVYCDDCIDEVNLKLKPLLDRKLWAFR